MVTTLRGVLADSRILPSATTLRFAVLVLLIIATTGSMYEYIGIFTHQSDDAAARACMASTPPISELPGDAPSTLTVLGCTLPFTGLLAAWAAAGVGLLVIATLTIYALTPRFLRLTRRLRPLDPAGQLHAAVIARVAELSSEVGLSLPPLCLVRDRIMLDSTARVFGLQRRGCIELSAGLVGQFLKNPVTFDGFVLHELAHLRNRDVRPGYLTLAAWRAFLLVSVLPFAAVVLAPLFGTAPQPPIQVIVSVAFLLLVVNLTYRSVFRARESHADATAANVDLGAMHRIFSNALDYQRKRRLPDAFHFHPDIRVRLADLVEPARLANPSLLAMFAAGLAVSLLTVSLTFFSWLALLNAWQDAGDVLAKIVKGDPEFARAAFSVRLQLFVGGPATILVSVVLARLAGTTMWRMRVAELFGGPRPKVWKVAIPFTLGMIVGEPLSVLYANAGVWGVYDTSLAFQVADVVISALTLAVVAIIVCRLASESAVVWIPVARKSLRGLTFGATVVLAAGVAPALFTWLPSHNTMLISRLGQDAGPEMAGWFGAGWTTHDYAPTAYLESLSGAALLFAVPLLFTVVATLRRPPSPGLGLPGRGLVSFGPALRWGIGGGVLCAAIATGVLTYIHDRIGNEAIMAKKYWGSMFLMGTWALWTVGVLVAVLAFLVSRRIRAVQLTAALFTVFVAATVAGLFAPVPVFSGIAGVTAVPAFLTAYHGETLGYMIFGVAWVPLEAALAVMPLAGLAVLLGRERAAGRHQPRTLSRRETGWQAGMLIAVVLIAAAGACLFFTNVFLIS